jgi:hypothetical protein
MPFATEIVSVRLNTSAALSVTAPVPSVPDVPPLPIWSVPPLIVVVPVYELAPPRTSVPVSILVSAPVWAETSAMMPL